MDGLQKLPAWRSRREAQAPNCRFCRVKFGRATAADFSGSPSPRPPGVLQKATRWQGARERLRDRGTATHQQPASRMGRSTTVAHPEENAAWPWHLPELVWRWCVASYSPPPVFQHPPVICRTASAVISGEAGGSVRCRFSDRPAATRIKPPREPESPSRWLGTENWISSVQCLALFPASPQPPAEKFH